MLGRRDVLGGRPVIDRLGPERLAGDAVLEGDVPGLLEGRRDLVVARDVGERVARHGPRALAVDEHVLDAVARRRGDGVLLGASGRYEAVAARCDGAAAARARGDDVGDVDVEVPSGIGAGGVPEDRLDGRDVVRAASLHREAGLLRDGLACGGIRVPVLPDEGALGPVVIDGLGRREPRGTLLAVELGLDVHLHGAVGGGLGVDVVGAGLDGRVALAALHLDPGPGLRRARRV